MCDSIPFFISENVINGLLPHRVKKNRICQTNDTRYIKILKGNLRIRKISLLEPEKRHVLTWLSSIRTSGSFMLCFAKNLSSRFPLLFKVYFLDNMLDRAFYQRLNSKQKPYCLSIHLFIYLFIYLFVYFFILFFSTILWKHFNHRNRINASLISMQAD